MTLYELRCKNPQYHTSGGVVVWHNQHCYVEVEPTDRICVTHNVVSKYAYRCSPKHGGNHDCEMVDIVRLPKEDDDGF